MLDRAVWWVWIRIKGLALSLPLPMYVLTGTLCSLADLCEVILPRLGRPNYAADAYDLLKALAGMPRGMPLVAVDRQSLYLCIRRVGREEDTA